MDSPNTAADTSHAEKIFTRLGFVAKSRSKNSQHGFFTGTEGLNGGERLVVEGQHLLRDESRVTISRPDSSSAPSDAGSSE